MEPFFPLSRNVVHTRVVLLAGVQTYTNQDTLSLSDPFLAFNVIVVVVS